MLKNKLIIIVSMLTLVGFLAGCTAQKNYVSSKTSLELQSIQKKEFDTTYKTAFASILSVFQDKGYVIDAANADTGLITAAGHKTRGFIPFVGQSIEYVKATAFIESMASKNVSIRLNFVNHQETSSGYGMQGGNSVPIEDPEFYKGIFARVEKAIFVRTAR
jgi:PBP1b-binding outer membrane lipoprotein LpoB